MAGIVAGCWGLLLVAPYALIGEWWGAVWFVLNRPLADIAKPYLFPVSVVLYVAIVTVINATLLYGVVWLVLYVWSLRKTGH
jgi:hypothetical protein